MPLDCPSSVTHGLCVSRLSPLCHTWPLCLRCSNSAASGAALFSPLPATCCQAHLPFTLLCLILSCPVPHASSHRLYLYLIPNIPLSVVPDRYFPTSLHALHSFCFSHTPPFLAYFSILSCPTHPTILPSLFCCPLLSPLPSSSPRRPSSPPHPRPPSSPSTLIHSPHHRAALSPCST